MKQAEEQSAPQPASASQILRVDSSQTVGQLATSPVHSSQHTPRTHPACSPTLPDAAVEDADSRRFESLRVPAWKLLAKPPEGTPQSWEGDSDDQYDDKVMSSRVCFRKLDYNQIELDWNGRSPCTVLV